MMQRLNSVLVDGVKVVSVYEQGRKIRDLSLLRCLVTLEYDNAVPDTAFALIKELFHREHLLVPKKTKSGIQDQDIIPMIRTVDVVVAGEKEVVLDALVCCQNPTLNPAQLALAVEMYLPEIKPDFSRCERIEIYDKDVKLFR